MNKTRLESLTEGVFATVMTVLVLTLTVPILTGPNLNVQLGQSLKALLPNVLTYIISFLVLGMLWIGHNVVFRFIGKLNRKMTWLAIFFLLSIAIIPFSTSLMGKYPQQPLAVMLYGINLFVAAFIFDFLLVYLLLNKEVLGQDAEIKRVKNTLKNYLVGTIIYIVGIAFAFVNTEVSIALYIIIPFYYLIMGSFFFERRDF